jgi:hypothetical protein
MSFRPGWQEQLAGIVEAQKKRRHEPTDPLDPPCGIFHVGMTCQEFDAYVSEAESNDAAAHILRMGELHHPSRGTGK